MRIVHWGIDAGALFPSPYLTLFLPVEDIG